MTDSIGTWMGEAAVNRQALACGVRLADKSVAVRAFRDGLTEAAVEQAFRKVAEAVALMQRSQLAPQRLRWTFDNREIHCLILPDGTMAALFVNSSGANSGAIDALLESFPAEL